MIRVVIIIFDQAWEAEIRRILNLHQYFELTSNNNVSSYWLQDLLDGSDNSLNLWASRKATVSDRALFLRKFRVFLPQSAQLRSHFLFCDVVMSMTSISIILNRSFWLCSQEVENKITTKYIICSNFPGRDYVLCNQRITPLPKTVDRLCSNALFFYHELLLYST